MSHIQTYARLKPCRQLYEDFQIIQDKIFQLQVPEAVRDYGCSLVKTKCSSISYDFAFDHVFATNVDQEEIFNTVALDIIKGFLNGYNGTIFAYGQTGTGKTYTMEGSALRYNNRGLAPRALAYIYQALEKRGNEDISLHISYLEIYQEVAYDLLSPSRNSSSVTIFPKVTVMEGPYGTCIIRNLSVHLAPTEEVAQILLFQGQTSRKVAETPVNLRSSRSHAVFTIYLTIHKPESDLITRSKLHLVDLAGSERVSKTGVDGQQLTEAKSINLSLHHLENVIVALQGVSSRQNHNQNTSNKSVNTSLLSLGSCSSSSDNVRQSRHVPYRNSLLTMVLRDSLGGNCQTAMIATISLEIHNLGETLSTLRFAQRVACITNHARRNDAVDDKILIKQLKRRITELETRMSCLKSDQGAGKEEDKELGGKLTDEDKLVCAKVVEDYLAGHISDPIMAGISDSFKFRECMHILKKMIISQYFQPQPVLNTLTRMSAEILDHHFQENSLPEQTEISTQTSAHAINHSLCDSSFQDRYTEISKQEPVPVADSPSPDCDAVLLLLGDNNLTKAEENQTDFHIFKQHPTTSMLRDSKPASDQEKASESSSINTSEKSVTSTQSPKVAVSREQSANRRHPSPKTICSASLQKNPVPTVVVPNSRSPQRASVNATVYKSPYEQKQEKEIQQLTRKLEGMKENQLSVEQQLESLRLKTELEELSCTENVIRKKIQVTKEQIADQHAYLLHLRHTEASPDVLQQEKLVEEQLLRREGKFEKKLKEIGLHKKELEKEYERLESPAQARVVVKPNMEDQYSHLKKRNGTLNTRQVFDLLKAEERKQNKALDQADQEQKILMSKQIAVKEAVTREKLRDLKEKLRNSREVSTWLLSVPPSEATYLMKEADNSGHSEQISLPQDVASISKTETVGLSLDDSQNVHNDATFEVESRDDFIKTICNGSRLDLSHPDSSTIGKESNLLQNLSASPLIKDFSASQAVQNLPCHLNSVTKTKQDSSASSENTKQKGILFEDGDEMDARSEQMEMLGKPASSWKSSLTTRWESGYRSRPSTAGSNKSSDWSMVQSNHSYDWSSVHPQNSPLSLSDKSLNQDGKEVQISAFSSSESVLNSCSIGSRGNVIGREQSFPGDAEVKSQDKECVLASQTVSKTTHHVKQVNSIKPQMDSLTTAAAGLILESDIKTAFVTPQATFHKERKKCKSAAIFPSEYVGNMHNGEKFDARKMGLSSKTFESALTAMLNEGSPPPKFTYGTEFYDQYSRVTKPSQRKNRQSDLQHKVLSMIYLESKNSPLSPKLAQFLGDDLSSQKRKMASEQDPTGTSKTVGKDAFLSRLTQLQMEGDSVLEDVKVISPGIQAIKENKHESTYMSCALAERERIAKIRRARDAAEAIQKAWRNRPRNPVK